VAVTELRWGDEPVEDRWIGFHAWDEEPVDTASTGLASPIRYRWSGKRGTLVGLFEPGDQLVMKVAHPDINERPVKVTISGDGRVIDEVFFLNHEFKRILTRSNELSEPREIVVEVNRTWNPRDEGLSGDFRDLGVAVAIVSE
jgi:hypothetical protein